MKNARHISTKVIVHQPGCYLGWPTIARLTSGEIVVGFSGGRQRHVCPFGKTQLVRSSDLGESWSGPVTINDSPLAETFFIPLTTVRQPTREMADLAVSLLLQAMNGNSPEPVVHSLKGELVPRDSTLLARPSPPPIDGSIFN